MKLCLDPGHGGSDPGAVYQNRYEKDDVLKLAMAVGDILKRHGITITYTRTTDIYEEPYVKANKGNSSNVDYFISFHRNSSPVAKSAKGVEILLYSAIGTKLTMANHVLNNLTDIGFVNRGIKIRKDLAVLNKTMMPALLIETGFINSDIDNKLFDLHFHSISIAIAKGILKVLNISYIDTNLEEDSNVAKLYRLQTEAFRKKESASIMVKKLKLNGYSPFVIEQNNMYKVQVGAYASLNSAKSVHNSLLKLGINTQMIESIK